ncbi:ubiquitin carboxyl-terminal hydrolase 1 [Thrips palmi]|uniref:Ubiquitin carboxyl-terminal hydrolase 1 n=1 Tax=Thrips palmi TaxID=161013 RepID=A0A6P8ZV43_THRPL|nr:ubiquitin carboxyl-terminal hydrolase 1 [Thrips palmi]XP_034249059.1 ubiquitin carboxyl-terminal hydrolase 1 [Thrips palmi]
MTVIATGTSASETSGPPPRKKICLSLSGKGRTKPSTAEADSPSEMSVTVNRVDANKRRFKKNFPQSDTRFRREALTGPLESGMMLNGFVSDSVNSIPASDDSPSSDAPLVATLCNLGNTCFLNSILYTLRFAPHFLHKLHHLVNDLADVASRDNTAKVKSSSLGRSIGLSSKHYWNVEQMRASSESYAKKRVQAVSEKLHEVYESLHNAELKESTEPFQPDVFLHALREVNPIFEGNQQHDAHELLGCLLNYMRETCQDLAKQLESHQNSELCNGASSVEDVKKETKGSLLAHVGLSSSTSSISGAKWGMRKSWKRKKPLSENFLKPNRSGKNGGQPSVISNGNATGQQSSNGEATSSIEPAPNEPRILVNGEAHEISDGDSAGKENGSCSLRPLQETDEADNAEEKTRLNFIEEDFEGVMVLCTRCLECECITEMKEAFYEIGVPIASDQDPEIREDGKRISELYRSSVVTEELLHHVNKYWCEHCLRYNEARRSVRYETLPRLLTLQMKRFSSTFGSMVCMSKVNDFMPTPLILDCFCEECLEAVSKEQGVKHRYQLYGVIMHLGATIASGHYVAYVRASDPISEYRSCDKDKRKTASLIATNATKGSNQPDSEKGRGLLKFFSRNKSNTSDAVSTNHLTNPHYRNTCRSLDCCGIRLNRSYHSAEKIIAVNGSGAGNEEAEEEGPEPAWLECDDETVRVLSRQQLEDILAPKQSKNSSLTPYLLFYARIP